MFKEGMRRSVVVSFHRAVVAGYFFFLCYFSLCELRKGRRVKKHREMKTRNSSSGAQERKMRSTFPMTARESSFISLKISFFSLSFLLCGYSFLLVFSCTSFFLFLLFLFCGCGCCLFIERLHHERPAIEETHFMALSFISLQRLSLLRWLLRRCRPSSSSSRPAIAVQAQLLQHVRPNSRCQCST